MYTMFIALCVIHTFFCCAGDGNTSDEASRLFVKKPSQTTFAQRLEKTLQKNAHYGATGELPSKKSLVQGGSHTEDDSSFSSTGLSQVSEYIDGEDFFDYNSATGRSSSSNHKSGFQLSMEIVKSYNNLHTIHVKSANIVGAIQLGLILKAVPNLQTFVLDDNRITALEEEAIYVNHSMLMKLSVKNNHVKELNLKPFTRHCSALVTLDVSGNKNLAIHSEDIEHTTQMLIDCSRCGLSKKALYTLNNNALVMPKSNAERKFEMIMHTVVGMLSFVEGFGSALIADAFIESDMPLVTSVSTACAFSGIWYGVNYLAGFGLQKQCFPMRDIRLKAAYRIQCNETPNEMLNPDDVV